MNRLKFIDLLVLACIIEYYNENKKPPTERMLLNSLGGKHTGLVNDKLKESGILELPIYKRLQYSDRLTGAKTLQKSLSALTTFGLISEKKYAPTDLGESLHLAIEGESRSNLLAYPSTLSFSVDGGSVKINHDNSTYAEGYKR